MSFTQLYFEIGPDVEELATAFGIRPSDADRLKNYIMERRPLLSREMKHINERARYLRRRKRPLAA